jgi:urease accessory protein
MRLGIRFGVCASAIAVVAPLAWAHPGKATDWSSATGLIHPFTGWDHLVAMICVGLWAAQLGGKARWIVPLGFLSAMSIGGAIAASGLTLPLAERAITTSILILGVLIAVAGRMPALSAALLVGLFAIFHGYTHVHEMPLNHSLVSYGAGFMLATALLHLAGLWCGTALLQSTQLRPLLRLCGGAVAVFAVATLIGLI